MVPLLTELPLVDLEGTMDRTKKSSDLFFATFLGEYVEILAKYETTERVPLTINGYLLDMDNDFYFTGENSLEVNAAVRKSDVVFISIIPKLDPGTEILENFEVPEDENESN